MTTRAQPFPRPSASPRGWLRVLVVWTVLWGVSGPGLAPTWAQDDPQMAPGQLFVPAPRELVRPLIRAKRAFENQDYRLATELLGTILGSTDSGDYLQPLPDNPFRAVSIHNQAQQLLGRIPRSERVDYELQYGVPARQMLERAVQAADYDLIARVARSYFYTEAGHQATMLLGHHFLELGQPVSAVSSFSAIVSDSAALADYDPEVSVLLATSWLLADNPARAQTVLEQLAGRHPRGRLQFQGNSVPLFQDTRDALPWLVRLIGNSSLSDYKVIDDWLMFRGNAKRNARQGTGFPLPFERWFVPTVNEPAHESVAESIFRARLASGQNLLPGLQPIAVADTIVIRSLDRMLGVDFKTGKRIWEFPAWHPDSLMEEDRQSEKYRQEQTSRWHVDQRIWSDHLFGHISSNGRKVFVIDQPGYAASVDEGAILRRGIRIDSPVGGRIHNELKAVDLVRQGAFCWEVGGETGGRVPELAGCFFLGAPLPLDDRLYVLGELDGEILLIVLHQETGDLLWSQQIAAIDSTPPITIDRIRRLAAASPSFSDGVLICPTSASGIVALELSTRSLLWGVQYPSLPDSLYPTRARFRSNPRGQVPQTRSVDSTVTIAEGHVIVMPVENDRVLCYDLLTGQAVWDQEPVDPRTQVRPFGRPVDDSLYIACVHQGQVILVGQTKVRSLDLLSGQTRWTLPLEEYGQPTGRGFLANDSYYFPTSESKIVEIDIPSATISRSVETNRILGNLICYKGDVISQGYDVVSTFRQSEPVRREVDQALARQGIDELPVEMLLFQAQLMAQENNLISAVSFADTAYRNSPGRTEQLMLMNLVLKLMDADYRAAEPYINRYADELSEFRPSEFVAARFAGLAKNGEFDAALDLLDESGFALHPLERPGGQVIFRSVDHSSLRLRLDAWLRDELFRAIRETTGDEPRQRVRQWREQNADQLTPDRLDSFARLFGNDLLSANQLVRLADWYVSRKDFLRAEQALDAIPDPDDLALGDPATRATISANRCKLLSQAGWKRKALQLARRLGTAFAETPFVDPWSHRQTTGIRFMESRLAEFEGVGTGNSAAPVTWDSWSWGVVESRFERLPNGRISNARMLTYPELHTVSPGTPEDLRVEIDIFARHLIVKDSLGNRIGHVNLDPESGNRGSSSRTAISNYALHGHLLICQHGYRLSGIDLHKLRADKPALIWNINLQEKLPDRGRIRIQSGPGARRIQNPWGLERSQYVENNRSGGRLLSNFASNPRQVFYRTGSTINAIDVLTGELIWQRSDLGNNGWLVADDEIVGWLVPGSPTGRPGGFKTVTLLDARSGQLIRSVELTAPLQKMVLWNSMGTQLVFSSTDSREQKLTHFDLATLESGWSRTWPGGSRGCFYDPGTMVIVSPEGQAEYLDLRTGQVSRTLQLDSGKFDSIQTMKLNGHDLLLLKLKSVSGNYQSSRYQASLQAIPVLADLFDGLVFCVDRQTSRLAWSHPMRVENFSVPRSQPYDLPVMTFGRRISYESRHSPQTVEFYSVDLRDGRLVDWQQISNWAFRTQETIGAPAEGTISLNFGDRMLTLRLLPGETAPAAPASLTNRFTLFQNAIPDRHSSRVKNRAQRQRQLIQGLQPGPPRQGNRNEQ